MGLEFDAKNYKPLCGACIDRGVCTAADKAQKLIPLKGNIDFPTAQGKISVVLQTASRNECRSLRAIRRDIYGVFDPSTLRTPRVSSFGSFGEDLGGPSMRELRGDNTGTSRTNTLRQIKIR